MRSGSSCPWGAVNWRIMLASLVGWHCATASGPWRCASHGGPPVSAGPGSGVRPPPSRRGWSSSSSVCLHCALCTCVCQCIGGGGGSQQYSLEDPRIIAFGGGGGRTSRAAAAGLSATGLCRSSVRLDSGSAAAEALAALAGLSLTLGWVRAVRFTTGLKDRPISSEPEHRWVKNCSWHWL